MTTQTIKMVFENTQYLEAMEAKANEQLANLSAALFQLYEANSEKLNRENLFQIVKATH